MADGFFHDFEGKFVYDELLQSTYQIFTLNSDKSNQITNSTINKVNPQWSPDGKHIIYLSRDLDGLNIHVMDENGQNDTSLISTGKSVVGSLFYPTLHFSPDGKTVALSRADSIIIYSVKENFEMHRIASYSCITDYKYLIWAPNSEYFSCACKGLDSFRHLHVYNLATAQLNDITKDLGHSVLDQSWSHNSALIAFISSFDIFIINPDGTGLQKIINTPNFLESELAFSPLDDRMVYQRADSLHDLVMYDLQTQESEILINDKESIKGPLIWIENGKFIFYGYGEKMFDLDEFRVFEIETKKNLTIINDLVKGIDWFEE